MSKIALTRRHLLYSGLVGLVALGATTSASGAASSVATQAAGDLEHDELRQFLQQTINSSNSFEDRFDAEVWLVDMSSRLARFVPDTAARLALLQLVHSNATQAQLPPELVLALIEVESAFDRFAVSRAGAQGLMQVMPFWKDEIGRAGDNLTDVATNLSYGCRILQFYLQREKGDLPRGLARYNGSLGRTVYSDKVERAWQKHWKNQPLNWR